MSAASQVPWYRRWPQPADPEPEQTSRRFDRSQRRFLLGFFLCAATLFMLTSGGHSYSIDEELMFQGTRSLVNLDAAVAKDFPNDELYRLREDGTYATVYGIGQSIAGVPMYVLGRGLATLSDGSGDDFTVRAATFMTNAILTAAIAAMVVAMSFRLGASFRGSAFLGLAYSIGTFAFAHSKTFGSEPGAALLTLVGCYLAIAAGRHPRPRTLYLAGLGIGLAPLFRISTIAFLPVVGLYVLWTHRRQGPAGMLRAGLTYSAGGFTGLGALAAFNWWRYGSPIDMGYGSVSAVTDYPPVKGLVNLYFSTGKSFFLFAPICAVVVAGLLIRRRRLDAELWLLVTLVSVNSVIVARLSVWSGDLTWGPRYLQVTLPLFVCLGAPLVDSPRWRRPLRWSTVAGLLGPALLGVLLYFNVFFINANDELGASPVASEDGQPMFVIAVRHDLSWNQLLGNLELLPAAVRDTFGERRADDPVRYTYVNDPTFHYGYFGAAPRIDFWWLWIEPTNTSRLTYLLFLPIAATGGVGGWLIARSKRSLVQ